MSIKITTQKCSGAQEYAQSFLKLYKNHYIFNIEELIEKLQSAKKIDYTDPQTWKALELKLTLYEKNRLLNCKVYLLDNNKFNLKTNCLHVHSTSDCDIQDCFTSSHYFASLLVQKIHESEPNLESIAFFELDNYALLMVITK